MVQSICFYNKGTKIINFGMSYENIGFPATPDPPCFYLMPDIYDNNKSSY